MKHVFFYRIYNLLHRMTNVHLASSYLIRPDQSGVIGAAPTTARKKIEKMSMLGYNVLSIDDGMMVWYTMCLLMLQCV